jgi:hypothetical protein
LTVKLYLFRPVEVLDGTEIKAVYFTTCDAIGGGWPFWRRTC